MRCLDDGMLLRELIEWHALDDHRVLPITSWLNKPNFKRTGIRV